MIADSFDRIATETVRDHEMALAGAGLADADVQAVHKGARLPDLVPFWKPPNISERMTSTTIASSTSTRHPPARDCGQRRREPLDLYIRMDMPRHSAICRPRRII